MKYAVALIPHEVLDMVDEDARRLLSPSTERSEARHNIHTVMDGLYSGQFNLWMAFDENNNPAGAVVTSIEKYPLRKMVNLLFCAGDDLDGWHKEMLDALEKHMWETGCRGLEVVGRYGWQRFLKKYGWEANYVVCEKIFDEEQEARDVA
jgi:hypothetical protein|tara:strand:+ start:832 stop:1281 length:450 start_codon:yes stop_codon:yes gene_type:complete